jgi:hypothetical protein
VTRPFALVLAVVGCLLVWAFMLPPSLWAAVLASLALGIMLVYAVTVALVPVAARVDVVRDPRKIEDEAHAGMLAAFPPFVLAPGVCWHHAGAAAPGCDCGAWHAGDAR